MTVKKPRKKTAVKSTAVKKTKPAAKKAHKKADHSDTQALVKHMKHFVNEISKSIQKLVGQAPKRKAAKKTAKRKAK